MTDQDVISDAHRMTGVGTVNAYTPRNRAHKPSWYWTVNAHSHTAWLVAELAPLLGHRRRSAAIGLWSAGGHPADTFPARRELTPAEGIPWVAGIVEGEGCISVSARGDVSLGVNSTDLDTIVRLHAATGIGRVYERPSRNEKWRPTATWNVCRINELRELLLELRPWLKSRRRVAIDRALICLASKRGR
ncbi:hypothetical protein AB0F59_15105 [Micromonospora lupini]|uniref:hypothetical protein n=1 Tax=Micromonospora lupini TaxID=285679 RepID=UPI00341099FD